MPHETARRYSVTELEAMPTLTRSLADDLKVDTGTVRVWLSRLTREDGMPYDNQVTVETYDKGMWSVARVYRAPSN